MPNAYLERLRSQYEEIRGSIDEVQTRAVSEDREVTEDELRSVEENRDKALKLAKQIEDITEDETRAAKVAELSIPEVRKTGNAQTKDRDPGHYRSTKEGGSNSFFGDMYRARYAYDEVAQRRLVEHTRAAGDALGTATQTGVVAGNSGVIPPKWMTDLYLPLQHQNRVAAGLATPLDLGNDPRAIVLPYQVASVQVANQTEGQPVTNSSSFSTTTQTLTPAAVSGEQTVTRQLLDSTTPAIDALIAQDLLAEYDETIESKVCAAIIAAAQAGDTFATDAGSDGTAFMWEGTGVDAVIDAKRKVRTSTKVAPSVILSSTLRLSQFDKMKDNEGRKILGDANYGPQNVAGLSNGSNEFNGLEGVVNRLPLYVTTGLDVVGDYPDVFVVVRASDVLLAESDLMQFRFEEAKGPQDIVLGLWRYAGVAVRIRGTVTAAVKSTVTAAAGA